MDSQAMTAWWKSNAPPRVERDEKAIAELEAACIEANEEVNAMVSELQQMRGAA